MGHAVLTRFPLGARRDAARASPLANLGGKTQRSGGLLTDVALKFSATQRKWCLFSLTNLISTNTGNFISSVFTSLIKSV